MSFVLDDRPYEEKLATMTEEEKKSLEMTPEEEAKFMEKLRALARAEGKTWEEFIKG